MMIAQTCLSVSLRSSLTSLEQFYDTLLETLFWGLVPTTCLAEDDLTMVS